MKQNASIKCTLPKHYIRIKLIWEPAFLGNSGLWLRGVGSARAEAEPEMWVQAAESNALGTTYKQAGRQKENGEYVPQRQEPTPLPLLYQEAKSISLLHSIMRGETAQRELRYLHLNTVKANTGTFFSITLLSSSGYIWFFVFNKIKHFAWQMGGAMCVYVYTRSKACGCTCTGVCYASVCSCTWRPILDACYLPKPVFTLHSEVWSLTKPGGKGFGESGSSACLEDFPSLPPAPSPKGCDYR